ncbi:MULTISPECIES: hypothetical protein [unclassified Bosea (in: a-proteobacteria)]|uniref:hypothetical protein n=1 Tax=unclassified Bosea (in: a-proteobacteria) TaxID=2653178 RepID=UPI000F7F7ADF|nr:MULTISPECIES: hypothetical protein [unclassified Bosea (in: a-proteobacteria)]
MAIEAHVLFDASLPSIKDINAELRLLGFPVRLQYGHGPLADHGGFLPATLRRQQSGCEFDVRSGSDAAGDLEPPGAAKPFSCCVSLRWASNEDEAIVGLCIAAALAKLTKGIVLEEGSGKWQNAAKAVDYARLHLKAAGVRDGPAKPGTRPADIKRYLKTLLAERDDLVLVGRHLLIRPVHHILRGVLFDRTGERTRFRIWPYLNPLYGHPDSTGCLEPIHESLWDVTAVHFMPVLHDALLHDVFADVGAVTTLPKLASRLKADRQKISACVIALVLSGRHETASTFLDSIAVRDPTWDPWLVKDRQFLDRDIKAICAEFHEREERTVQALKIGAIWEPSPFPAELPEHEREAATEPQFHAGRWPATPDGLLARLPEQRGELRFSKDYIFRRALPLLLEPITIEAGRRAYQANERLIAAQRLPDGKLLLSIMRPQRAHQSWIDQASPQLDPFWVDTRLLLYGSERLAEIWLSRRSLSVEPLSIHSIEIRTKDRRHSIWHCNFEYEQASGTVFDYRSVARRGGTSELSPELCAALVLDHPVPGAPDDVLHRTRQLIDGMGYGELDLDLPFERS